jgi:hypothetical protein
MNFPNNHNNSQQPEWKTIGLWVAILGSIGTWIPLIFKENNSFQKEQASPQVEIVAKQKCTKRGILGLCID